MRRLTLLALLALPVACASPDGPGPGAVGAVGARPTLEAAAARLPESAAGFTRGNAVWHEPERPGLGVTVEFAAPARAAVATVTLYDRTGEAVAGGPADPLLAQEFGRAVEEVVALAGTRTNQVLHERGRTELTVPGGPPLACARLEGTYGRQEMRELVCLGAAAGRFLHVQVTSPIRPVRPVDTEAFVAEIARAARGG